MKIKFDTIVTEENEFDIIDSLTDIQTKIYEMVQHLAFCSRCEDSFNKNDKDSQWTEDGVLCPDCHEQFSIEYPADGGVLVIENKTGRHLDWTETRWL